MGKYIVTGGAGFIGSNVITTLNERGEDDILVVDVLGSDEKWKNLVGLKYADYWELDDFRFHLRNDTLGEVDAVIHLGACSATTERNASYLVDNNYRFTRELSEWCLAHNIRFVYASSGATYGDGALGYRDDLDLLPDLRPLNMYGYSKHMFDLWALRQNLFERIVGLKYFNVYGPREAHKGDMRSVVHKAWGQIKQAGVVKLFKSNHPDFKDGEQLRDFVYVKDAVAVTLYFADNPGEGGIFNVGTGRARTWLDLTRATFAALGREPKIEFVEMPENIRDKYQNRTEADIRNLLSAGYRAEFISLEDGVRDYVQWLEKNG